jgi:allantoicase/malate synthase
MAILLTEVLRLKKSDIPYYEDYISSDLQDHLLKSAKPFKGVPHLVHVGESGGLESKESLTFVCELYDAVKDELNFVLNRRIRDRKFIDERTLALAGFNQEFKRDFLSPDYKTVFGMEDGDGRIVFGPKSDHYCREGGNAVAPVPEYLQGTHVTLFGPPDNAKLCINAMNAYHRKLKEEPAVVEELLKSSKMLPKWGADDEDSKTPMREDLISAGENLSACLDGTLKLDGYSLAKTDLSLPIKRFPGLALPCFFLFYKSNPLPLHLYDFALHLYRNWHNPKALCFYVPKLENEEEARYIKVMIETAEKMIKAKHSSYKMGTIRLMIVLENPRAVFRAHEIMDELHPYFVGASLGWHDYLASTARLFKEDHNYRIPVKADPNIVIKYIKASHDLLAQVVGSRGGIKIGGMYGILPTSNDLSSPSFQITMKGYIKDVVTQFKRDLSGFWVAHPDFVRLGLALVEAWNIHKTGDSSKLDTLVTSLLHKEHHQEILSFIHGADIQGLDKNDPLYPRSLIVADIKESTYIANNHPDEIRYNVFQSLQYITDWLSGNGCVALPSQIGGVPVRVMDDLATAERSRWEVWHEIYHGRFNVEEFIKIAHEELHFIRKDLSNDKKIVQVKWDARTEKWYPLAMKLMIKLMTDKEPVEFATQLLLPFTMDSIRNAENPWAKALSLDPKKFAIDPSVLRFDYYFEMCGSLRFAKTMSEGLALSPNSAKALIMSFTFEDILDAASFHGDIGEGKKTLDKMASGEQAKVFDADENVKAELKELGAKYKEKFGMKFLISAKGKSGPELLEALQGRINNTHEHELMNARTALAQITDKRIKSRPLNTLVLDIEAARLKHKIKDAQVTIASGSGLQTLSFGTATCKTWFEMASLSKTVGSAFALEYFKKKGIPLSTSVDELLEKSGSDFRLNDDRVKLNHLMNHMALNMHYVNGVPANKKMPPIRDFLTGNDEYGYAPIKVLHTPGETFQYSGGGFLVLEHLLESLEGKSIFDMTRAFLDQLGMKDFSFEQKNLSGVTYAHGFNEKGLLVEGTRKMFPAFAAGSMGTSEAMENFLVHLETAYHDLKGSGPLSHDTARLMLFGQDKGCKKFMGVTIGLGVFIGEAGLNKFAIHQGANDGFRCIYAHCFAGPDRGKGLVVLSNGDFNGVLFNAEVSQLILKELNIEGIDTSKFKSDFVMNNILQEEVVNMGYKNLVFNAFAKARPEPITDKGPKDPLSSYNLAVGAKVLDVTNELFAQAENLVSDHLPKFDPELFGKQGKVMDSWETVRHNLAGYDSLTLELKKPAQVRYVLLSTKYHTGNHSPVERLEALIGKTWEEIVGRTSLTGHSEMRIKLPKLTGKITQIKATMYPDGGFTRLGLYGENLPEKDKKTFDGVCRPYVEKVPMTKKPMSIPYEVTPDEVALNWKAVHSGTEFNNASSALGAKILKATDEHYSPAVLVLSPFAPINMFDGMESARSRTPGHFEEVIVGLAKPLPVQRLEMNFTYFVNNNPLEVSVEALVNGEWKELIPKTNVKAFAGNKVFFDVSLKDVVQQVRVRTYPDGGMNRLKVMSRL